MVRLLGERVAATNIARAEAAYVRENGYFNVAGTLFLVVQLIIVSALAPNPETRNFLVWLCNNFCFFLAVACYMKNMQLVKGIGYVGLIAQVLWVLDFLSPYFGLNISSIADYIATEGFTYANIVSIGVHTLIPVAILALSFRIRPEFHSLVYSFPYALLLLLATLLLTDPSADTNCVFAACGLTAYVPFPVPYHVALWPLYAMVPAALGYFIHKIFYFAWNTLWKGRVHLRI